MAKTEHQTEDLNANVEMVLKNGKSTRSYRYELQGLARLGREIKISPKSHVTINKPGYSMEMFVESVSIVIGIGNDQVADLVMSKEAWEALLKGEKIHITTTEEFKKKYVYKVKNKK